MGPHDMAVVQFDIFIGLVLPIVYGPQGMVHCVDNVFYAIDKSPANVVQIRRPPIA